MSVKVHLPALHYVLHALHYVLHVVSNRTTSVDQEDVDIAPGAIIIEICYSMLQD